MAGIVFSIIVSSLMYSARAVLLQNSMTNNYPQVVVRGCESQKSNLFYDNERKVWMEDLTDRCRDDEQDIFEFCQKAYSMLDIENIVALDSPLSFGDWCELNRTETDLIKRCKIRPQAEAIQVKPIRCLHKDSAQENSLKSGGGCVKRILQDSSKCQSIEKWNQKASDDCSTISLILSSELNPVNWCRELAEYSSVEFLCCPFGDSNDDHTSEEEDDEVVTEPTITKDFNSRSQLLESDQPEWMKNEPNWPRESAFFADDEDMADEQNVIPLSSFRRSNLTLVEHDRFTVEKKIFEEKYQAEIDELKSRWRLVQSNTEGEMDENTIEEFRQNFETLKQRAMNEQRAMNTLHETNLDRALDLVKNETNLKIQKILSEKPFDRASFQYWTYQYLHALLRDRIHLVNRYERLQATDPEQAKEKRDFIHQRLNSISRSIDQTLLTLKENQKLHAFASPKIDQLIDDYREVNLASERLLLAYNKELNNRNAVNPSAMKPFNANDQNDAEPDGDENRFLEIDKTKIDLKASPDLISDQDWTLSEKFQNLSFRWFHFVYVIAAFGVLFLIIRTIIHCRGQFKSRNNTKLSSNCRFTPIDSSTLEDKSLRDLQLNGYENPTYKFFEKPQLKC